MDINDRYHERIVILSSIGPVLVDTCLVPNEKYYETLVVKCDQDGQNADWSREIDFNRYATEEAAREGHKRIVAKWEV